MPLPLFPDALEHWGDKFVLNPSTKRMWRFLVFRFIFFLNVSIFVSVFLLLDFMRTFAFQQQKVATDVTR
jgi:hypothetical protein